MGSVYFSSYKEQIVGGMMTEKTEEDVLLIPVPVSEQIKPGDWVERRWGDGYRREYKVKKGKYGLAVRYQSGKYWGTDDLPLPEFHWFWRKVTASPAVRFIKLFVEKMREKSTQARPNLIHEAISLAVKAQMRFDPDDFSKIRYLCSYSYSSENEYRFVVESGNDSALAAMEKYMNREPFWYDALDDDVKKRLYVGASFKWEGVFVRVTSIKDKNTLVACHQTYEFETREIKTHRIFRISRDDLARFTEMRRSLLKLSQWVFEKAPGRKLAYCHKPSGEIICSTCVEAARKASGTCLDDEFVTPTELERACARCGNPLHTEPSQEERIFALVEAEKSAPGDADLARWLFHAFPLGIEMAYLERLVGIGERNGILK